MCRLATRLLRRGWLRSIHRDRFDRRCGLRQVGDVEAIVVVAPLALGEHCGRNLLDREVREGIGLSAKGGTADQQAAAVANLIAQLRDLIAGKRLGRDVKKIILGGTALLPVKLIAGRISETHDLAHGFCKHGRVVLLADNEVAEPILLQQRRRDVEVAEAATALPSGRLGHTSWIYHRQLLS